ncbi:hypothetical protein EVAR_43799_1 [Eumeta japonica]|uniref:Uncharacterized protein n=1 Tax=Eumeta variegata TaxID=151549 RepID=A0A4C1XUR3_EUMVA|nr:hypothetical protein EVAR_43799_1 [Eumeta japonica]
MRRSLVLSLFSIKNSCSFVPLNFINEAIIRARGGAAGRGCGGLINAGAAGHLNCMKCRAFHFRPVEAHLSGLTWDAHRMKFKNRSRNQ